MFHRFKYITSRDFCQALSAKNINKKKLCPLVKTTELLEIGGNRLKCRGKGVPGCRQDPPHRSIHGSGPAHKNSFSDEEIREAVQQALEVFPVGAQMMLEEFVHIHILGQAHHQIFVQLLMLHAEGLHIHLA